MANIGCVYQELLSMAQTSLPYPDSQIITVQVTVVEPPLACRAGNLLRLLARWLVNSHLAENGAISAISRAAGTREVLDFPAHTSPHVN